jgi:DNA polymerase III subunit beta
MNFVVSSSELLSHLQSVSRVINPKNTLPILDNFLFNLEDKVLEITASDLETTLITRMSLENVTDGGIIAIPARILLDTLKEFPDQPLTFEANIDSLKIVISSENGKFTIMGQNGSDFPQAPPLKENQSLVQMPVEALMNGVNKTFFATAEDELRPVMNGIYFELSPDSVSFVATDAHKLVLYKRSDVKAEESSSFILPKKPASMLKGILPREEGNVNIEFDEKNAYFNLSKYKMVCRLVEGNYPSYNAVIPKENPNKLTIDRLDLYNTMRRVSVFSNQGSNLVKLEMTGNQLTVSAQDIDFSISAYERLNCQYDGDEMEMGFKSTFFIEMLSNLPSADVVLEMSDPSRAGILVPAEKENPDEDILMLLMPMMVGQ